MSFDPAITLFSCHYTSQQSCAEEGKELEQLGFPASINLVRVPCTGKLQVTTLLKAFEDGNIFKSWIKYIIDTNDKYEARGIVNADFNEDGKMDIVVGYGSHEGEVFLYLQEVEER